MERVLIEFKDLTYEKQEEILNALSVVMSPEDFENDYSLDSSHEVFIQLDIDEEGIEVS